MDSALNPYSPGAGRMPQELAGRIGELERVDTLIARTRNRLDGRPLIFSGLRGVGKTVLLNAMQSRAEMMGWASLWLEGRADTEGIASVRARLSRDLDLMSHRLARQSLGKKLAGMRETISSFGATVGLSGVSLDISRAPTSRASSGDFELDLLDVITDVTDVLAQHGTGFMIFVDEMQDLDSATISSLVTLQHEAVRQRQAFFVIGAGLPNLSQLLTEHRSYAERLFEFRTIGTLDLDDAAHAVEDPARQMGVTYQPSALDHLLEVAQGYPYFLQEYGHAAWDVATGDRIITLDDVLSGVELGSARLDDGFYRSRWAKATDGERAFLNAMVATDPAPISEVAVRLGREPSALGPMRAQLIAKGLIYAPRRGALAYTVPGMGDYIRRTVA